ncbi:MAG TPA: hypothetical protein VM581_01240 [Magnetospirillaceae bacterium]|nr:hypothetical protein [Magnetospirillaceae bacterium]
MGSFDFLGLTEAQHTKRSLDAGVADFRSRKQRGMTTGGNIYLLFGHLSDNGKGVYQFERRGDIGIGDYAEYIINVSPDSGKLATVTEFGSDSEIAYYDFRGDTFFTADSPKTWIGGVGCRGVYQRHDGTWLTTAFAAAASGDAGPVDKSMARAVVGEAVFLWLMQVRAIDHADKAAKERAAR